MQTRRSASWIGFGFVLAFLMGFGFSVVMVSGAQADTASLESRVADLERRLKGAKIAWGDQINGQPWACGHEETKEPPYVMVGERDGTGCGSPNLNYYRTLTLVVPN
jgi:hypothetical protein